MRVRACGGNWIRVKIINKHMEMEITISGIINKTISVKHTAVK